ncbi:MAG: VanW family protein [Candidatus Margulisbacteria bacterium]|nr:VanW family protein [Candidatus Margulisiibacteriota bacterium]
MRTLIKILGIVALILAVFALSLVAYDFFMSRRGFPAKSFINGVNVSYLTQEQAVEKLQKYTASQLFTKLVTLETPTAFVHFPPEKIGIDIDRPASVKLAFRLSRKPNYLDELRYRMSEGATFTPLLFSIDEERLNAVLSVIAEEIKTASKEAAIRFEEKTGAYHITADIPGQELSIKRTISAVKKGLLRGQRSFYLKIDYIMARVTEEELRAHPPVNYLAGYTTYYGSHDSKNRIHNIKLLAERVDNTLLMPGETFSAVDLLGEVTEENGFKEAFVIINGELVPTLGGGACQIATTLYNAVSLADLQVLERKNHSFYFNIYPLGRDAAVYPGHLDFKFKNDAHYPVLFKATATDKKLSFKVFGTPPKKNVEFSAVKVFGKPADSDKFIPMSLKAVIDEDLPFRTEVTRTVYEKTKKIKEETIKSFYKLYGDKDNVPIKSPESI